jgi:mono/diheme cytochrome c family protein
MSTGPQRSAQRAGQGIARRIALRWHSLNPVQRVFAALLGLLGGVLLLCGLLIATEIGANNDLMTGTMVENNQEKPSLETVERGAYLAKLGNCAACHTARGGADMAGGKAIHTPFGAVYTSNITPDKTTGIGQWSQQAFYRALHEGRSADGRLLTPAFPYANYSHVTRQDADALYAYFMHAVAPVAQTNRAHELPFPLNTEVALAVWRVLFFDKKSEHDVDKNATKKIATYVQTTRTTGINDAQITRGAYLVRGLGHCSACHAQRNALGATSNDGLLSGALMPMQDWYAPSLLARDQAGVQHWPRSDVVALLKTGVAPHASVAGPMAEVVAKSTQYWSDADLQAAAAYLQSLPESPAKPSSKPHTASDPSATQLVRGAELFTQHCATCHGAQGQGLQIQNTAMQGRDSMSVVALPALAGNRAITMDNTANLVRIILAGGYAPSTAGNPRPYGMPPFVHVLGDDDIAVVTTYIRSAWGNQANAVSAADVVRHRKGLLP